MPRTTERLRDDWKFTREDDPSFSGPDYNDAAWESIRVPHDWAIYGPFAKENDIQYITKKQADVKEHVHEITGRTGGLPHVGTGWYRRVLHLPEDLSGKRIRIEFDGVMSHGMVYLNGTQVGRRPYGYSSFALDVSDVVVPGKNTLAVRGENAANASRWYPGAGIYRNVRLVILDDVHIAHWGVQVTTPFISDKTATVDVKTQVENHGKAGETTVKLTIRDPEGNEVAAASESALVAGQHRFNQGLTLTNPIRWSLEAPCLYTVSTDVLVGDTCVDSTVTRFGVRALSFDAETGFSINGKVTKLNGVCMHHDLGPLGTAINRVALKRQLAILQDMGCNAIRTSHNPPAPDLLDLTDEMGFVVLCEAFDEWAEGKVPGGYHNVFTEWAETDLRDMIRRDRNHPSVILWSIGNEIHEQGSKEGCKVAQFLVDICHDEDPTRLTTAGFNNHMGAINNGLADAVDVAGFNYGPHAYLKYHKLLPGKPIVGSETESTVSSRGEYYFPVNEEFNPVRESMHVNSFDMCYPGWGCSPDTEFRAQEELSFVMGQFVWTGFDYLGEPTPYFEQWPSRSSYFGIVDLCGLPKDRYYLYQSQWTDKEVLHLLPHWTWPGMEGQTIPVHCYTSFSKCELFVNGRSMGTRTRSVRLMMGRYRMVWPAVPYDPGELKVVAYNTGNEAVAEHVTHTAGAPAALQLSADREAVTLDGDDMAFITVTILDAKGNYVPQADTLVCFSIEGPAEIVAVGNGDQSSTEHFQSTSRRVFNGKCVAFLRSTPNAQGEIHLTATADDMKAARVTIIGRPQT